MTPARVDAAVLGGAAARREPGLITRAVLLAFSLSVPIDSLRVPGLGLAVEGAALALLLAAVVTVASSGIWRPIPPAMLALLAFAAWTAVTLLWAHDLPPALERVLTNVSLVAIVLVAWQLVRTPLDLRLILAGFVLGAGLVALGAWRSFLAGITHVEATYGSGTSIDEARYSALGFDPNDMGLTLAIGLVMAGYLGLTGTGRWRQLWLAYLPLALSAVALSGSRGAAFAAAFAVAAVLWWMARRNRRAFLLAMALLVAGGALVWLRTPETWERIFTVRQQLAGGSLGERLPIWRAGWELFLEHPLAGVGVGGFQSAVARGLGYAIVAHNTPLSVAAEAGLVGLVLFYGAVAKIAWDGLGAPRADRNLVLGLLATWFIGTASLTWENRKTTWLVLLIGAAVHGLGRDRAPAEDP